LDHGSHRLELGEHVFLRCTASATHHVGHLRDHRAEPSSEGGDLAERLLKDRRERKEPERVSCGRGVEDDDLELHRLDVPDRIVHTGQT
jgi:hypothetical protein